MKKTNLLILSIIALTSLSSCVAYKDGDGNIISKTISYPKDDTSLKNAVLNFPNSGITLDSTASSSVWTCPAPTMVPSELITRVPDDNDSINLRCISTAGCDTYVAKATRPKSADTWTIADDRATTVYTQNSIVSIHNNTVNNSGNTEINTICVPKAQIGYWI
ncbi:hypothetical protein LO80_01480 [Candidatus Francisella endociliophora]|uniref:Lipoprotein n=1 Tax=Candidatus Francisella endociliophora TaxID=653937 RepID=A0A097EMI1_9GAMM|nr:hypothetical protein [Francisella sp. FSC1006]AIT08776.1 hypothetical protein LO80_01480 [Francisella sp. FSC1006]